MLGGEREVGVSAGHQSLFLYTLSQLFTCIPPILINNTIEHIGLSITAPILIAYSPIAS